MDSPITRRRVVTSALAAAAGVTLAGCQNQSPTTQPSGGLTPIQQSAIAIAQGIQLAADTANTVLQSAALVDPTLQPDAALAQIACTELDTLVGQFIADATAGNVSQATLMAQIVTDLTTVLMIAGKHPAVSPVATSAIHEKMAAKLKH